MRKLVPIMLAVLLLFGCPHYGKKDYPTVSSISVESPEHYLSRTYKVYVSLRPDTPDNLALELYDNGRFSASLNLSANSTGPYELHWTALEDGTHTLRAALYDEKKEVSSKEAMIEVSPLGFSAVDDKTLEWGYAPVERELTQAQLFELQSPVVVRSIGVYMHYLILPPEGSAILVELRKNVNNTPAKVLASASLPSSSLEYDFSWEWVNIPAGELEAGEYWLVLSRNESEGMVVWARAKGNPYSSHGDSLTLDRTSEGSGEWASAGYDFVFQLSSQEK